MSPDRGREFDTPGFEHPPAIFLRLADIGVLVLALCIAYVLALGLQSYFMPGALLGDLLTRLGVPAGSGPSQAGPQLPPLSRMATILIGVVPVVMIAMNALGGYQPILRQSRTRLVSSCVIAPFVGMSALTFLLYTLRVLDLSRSFILVFGLSSACFFFGYRVAIRKYKRRRARAGHYARRVALVGLTPGIEWMIKFFAEHTRPTAFRVVGYFDVDPAQDPPAREGTATERLGGVDDLAAVLIRRPIHEVVAVISAAGAPWLASVTEACDYFRVTLRIVPEALLFGGVRDLQFRYHADELRLPEIVMTPPHLGSDQLFVKRVIDIIVSALLLVLLSPLFLIITIAIKLTTPRLPVFYRWRVIGYKGLPFTGYKFTTMTADADDQKKELLDRNEMTGPVFKIKRDPRVTPLGRFLRKFSLNELPQLWSVLAGDMSLVGPRPAFAHELERYELWHKRKLSVKPGITCLWQVKGRNRISNFDDWVKMDLEYIDNWSLWLDLKILARTAWVVVTGTGS